MHCRMHGQEKRVPLMQKEHQKKGFVTIPHDRQRCKNDGHCKERVGRA